MLEWPPLETETSNHGQFLCYRVGRHKEKVWAAFIHPSHLACLAREWCVKVFMAQPSIFHYTFLGINQTWKHSHLISVFFFASPFPLIEGTRWPSSCPHATLIRFTQALVREFCPVSLIDYLASHSYLPPAFPLPLSLSHFLVVDWDGDGGRKCL